MTRKTLPRKDRNDAQRKLKTLTPDDLKDVTGGFGVPGQYSKGSSGGGGTAG